MDEITKHQNMILNLNHTSKLKEVKEKPFKLEMNIQKVQTIFGLTIGSKHKSYAKNILILLFVYQHVMILNMLIFCKMFAKSKNSLIFGINNTCHVSHKNSAPGRVFAFYRLLLPKCSIFKAYALQ